MMFYKIIKQCSKDFFLNIHKFDKCSKHADWNHVYSSNGISDSYTLFHTTVNTNLTSFSINDCIVTDKHKIANEFNNLFVNIGPQMEERRLLGAKR